MNWKGSKYDQVRIGIMYFKNTNANPKWYSAERLFDMWKDPRFETKYYPELDFKGDATEEIHNDHRIFSGEIINNGFRRADFVRVIYKLYSEQTELIGIDSSFIDGTKFDSSYDRGEPATFALNGVIPGWQQILQKMPVGSKWKVFIPENLGYGIAGVYKDAKKGEYIIPPSSTLVFDIELLSIVE